MVKITSTGLGASADLGAGGESRPLESEKREDNSPDPAALSGAAAQAHFRLQRLENNSSLEDPANDDSLTPVGTLNVGDRHASERLNSPVTAAAAPHVSATDRIDLHVQAPPSNPGLSPEPSPSPRRDHEPVGFHSTSSGFLSFPLGVGGGDDEEEEERRRRLIPAASAGLGHGVAPGSTSPASAAASNQRYIFAVRDVHSMGGTPSALSIRNGAGDLVGRYDLPAGNSRLSVDLPPGDYTVEAQSGSRSVGGGGDNLDNFRVEVYSAGSTPSGAAPQ